MDRGRCYCEALGKDTGRMRRRNIPPGYCGRCLACGQPGHTRHSPLPVPSTEAYCDGCFDKLAGDYDAWRAEHPDDYTVDFVKQWWQARGGGPPGPMTLGAWLRRLVGRWLRRV